MFLCNEFEKRALNLLLYLKVKLISINYTQRQILERIEFLEKPLEGKANVNQSDLLKINGTYVKLPTFN